MAASGKYQSADGKVKLTIKSIKSPTGIPLYTGKGNIVAAPRFWIGSNPWKGFAGFKSPLKGKQTLSRSP